MNVLLISANVTLSPYPIYPLGIGMVASALVKAGHNVRQFDFLREGCSLEAVEREVRLFQPGLVGISVRNIDNVNLLNEQYYIDNIKTIVATIRAASGAKIVLGGAGFSLIPDLILKETGADYGVIGEGEALMAGLADDLERGVLPVEPLLGPQAPLPGAGIGSALYDERLMEYYLQSGSIASIQAKRGCPYRCVYCTYPLLEGGTVRARDPREVVDDIVTLRDKHHAKYIFFVDSVFNDAQGAYLELIDEMLRREVSIPWTGFIRPGGLTDEIVARMKKTGFASAEVGADAASDVTLERLGKQFTFQEIRECNDLLVRNGIATCHFFMFGAPGETEATVREGIDNILSLQKCVSFIFMGLRILPETPLERIAIEEGVISPGQDLLQPVFYLSPAVERQWLEQTLEKAFSGERHCVFPPDTFENSLQMLHKLGYSGTLWDLLLSGERARKRKAHGAALR